MSDTETNADPQQPRSPSTLMAYLKLMRIGNVFTAFANILI